MTDAKDLWTGIDEMKVVVDEKGGKTTDGVDMALKNQESAMYALEEAVDEPLEVLKEIKDAINTLEEQANSNLATARDAYGIANDLGSQITEQLVKIPMYVQVAEAAKLKAEAAYNIAK